MILIPLTWLYDELLLKYFSGVFETPPLLFAAFFGLSAGFMWAAVLGILHRGFKTGVFVSLLNALFFTIESVLKSTFPVYFSPGSILKGAGNVAVQYKEELHAGFMIGIGRMALFSLPVILSVLYQFIKARHKDETARTSHPSTLTALFLTIAILTHYGTCAAVFSGPYKSLYDAQYNFNDAAEAFGLTTALRLDICYAVFGNRYAGFHMTEGSSSEEALDKPEETSAPVPEDEDMTATASDYNGQEEESEPELPPPPSYNVMDIDFDTEAVQGKAAELSAYLASREPSLQNEYTGLFRGKNLILICAESYCDAFIRPELTPTLWRLTHNGFYFSDFYQPSWGGSTTTGELSLVEGLDSTAGAEAITDIADNNHYFTMGNQLQRLGYFSLAFHNGSHTFYHRNNTHEQLGYDAYFASGQHIEAFCGQSYPTDTQMFEGTLPAYIGHQPFSVYYMTVSGHAPYEKNSYFVRKYYDRVNEIVGDEYYEKTKYYICYQMELENALTELVKGLEEAGIADDTVIVLTGDHYPYGLGNGKTWHNDRDYIDDLIKADDVLYWNEDKNGLIIWSGSLENADHEMVCEISEPVSSLDILPTISNLFGVEYDSRLLPGRDVFAENTEPLVFWNNRSWITREGKYDSRKKVFYPAEGTESEENEIETDLESTHQLVGNMITMCSRIESLDYYGLLFGPDESVREPDKIWELLEKELEERNREKEEAQTKAETGISETEESVDISTEDELENFEEYEE